MSVNRSILVIAIMSVVTIALRALPFLIFSRNKQTPKIIIHLGKTLPFAVMAMLVVYCLKETNFISVSGFLPPFIASLVVVLSYLWKRNSLISIVLGTFVYMMMI